jgi:predicted nucleic acid-binding protein
MAEILIDTNVLVYAHDRTDLRKQHRALAVLDRLAETALGILSTQSLAEFCAVAMYKIPSPLSPEQAYAQVAHLMRVWPTVDITPQLVLEAVRGVRDYQLSYWDAQLWAAASLNNVPLIFSEDFKPGATIEGVRFVDPFAEDFQPRDWGL